MMPQRLTLDFAAPPAAARSGRILLGLGVVALVAGGISFGLAWEQRQRERAELVALAERGGAQHRNARNATAADAGAMRVAALVSRDLSAPWPELMRSMEASRSRDIALVRIEPIAARGSLRITADARHADAMIDYLEQLRAQGLAEVALTSHQVQEKQPGTPIRFQAQARWSGLTASGKPTEAAHPTSSEARPADGAAPPVSAPSGAADETERFLANARAAR